MKTDLNAPSLCSLPFLHPLHGDERHHLVVKCMSAAWALHSPCVTSTGLAASSMSPQLQPNTWQLHKCTLRKMMVECLFMVKIRIFNVELSVSQFHPHLIAGITAAGSSVCVWCKEKAREIWQNAFCMELATVATVTVWLTAVGFGFITVPCFVSMCVCASVPGYGNSFIYGCVLLCWWDEGRFSSAVKLIVPLSARSQLEPLLADWLCLSLINDANT